MSTYRSLQDLPKGRPPGPPGGGPPGGRPPGGPGPSGPPGGQPPASGNGRFDWNRYLEKGYFQPDGQIWPDLITTTAQRVAQEMARGGVTSHQVNRMFRRAAFLRQRVEDAADLTAYRADILAFLPDGAYQAGRDPAHNLPVKQFLDKNVPLAEKDKKHFVQGFYRHFVSVYQWYVWETKQSAQPQRR